MTVVTTTASNLLEDDLPHGGAIFRGGLRSMPRPKSQEIGLSQSLGAFPSFQPPLHRHMSDSASKIFHAGYLLKRSNHPVSAKYSNKLPADSPNSRLLQQRIRHASATLHELDSDDGGGSREEQDVFFADYDDDDDLPKLPPAHIRTAAAADAIEPPLVSLSPRGSLSTPSESIVTDSTTTEPTTTTTTSENTAAKAAASDEQTLEQDGDEEKRHSKVLNMLADFFGVAQPTGGAKSNDSANNSKSVPAKHDGSKAPISPKRSAPIKMPAAAAESDTAFHHRAQSEVMRQQEQGQPVDQHDEKGHVWRSKYCILQDGVLYFYRNKADADSPQAVAERVDAPSSSAAAGQANLRTQKNYESLARSPIPRRNIVSVAGGADRTASSPQNSHVWEKRTPLAMIGAVRSAEAEYGSHCFALLSPPADPPDDDANSMSSETNADGVVISIESANDKLILRARSAIEMSEWLFQFHRSIALFVKNLIQCAGAGGTVPQLLPMAASHRKGFDHSAALGALPSISSPRQVTLSHGHGRTSSRRRRIMETLPSFATQSSSSVDHSSFFLTPPRRVRQQSEDAINWFPTPDFGERITLSERGVSTTTTATTASTSPTATDTSDFLSPTSPPQLASIATTARDATAEETAAAAAAAAAATRTPMRAASRNHSEQNELSPELSAPPSVDPETERPLPASKKGAYVPPHMRRKLAAQQQQQTVAKAPDPPKVKRKYVPPHLRKKGAAVKATPPPPDDSDGLPQEDGRPHGASRASAVSSAVKTEPPMLKPTLGGCADPRVVAGSIMDSAFVPRKASKLKRELRTEPRGYRHQASVSTVWDIGSVSECGIRDSNEDSYLVSADLLEAFSDKGAESVLRTKYSQQHNPGLFCVFDGHLGDQAARFSAERFAGYLEEETHIDRINSHHGNDEESSAFVEGVVRRALEKLDDDFCKFCVQGGRGWESGTTALIAALVDDHLVVGNLGDARAVASRSVNTDMQAELLHKEGWSSLPDSDAGRGRHCLWKELSDTHSPSREDERLRIEESNGWITFEQQIPIAQLHRLNLQDKDVFDILQRCFADRYESSPKAAAPQRVVEISRVCGELAVSRSLGDRDFKAAFNGSSNGSSSSCEWDSPLFLTFPEDHTRCFKGDLILNTPEFRSLAVGHADEEFFLFACDGLWDVMDADDAVRVTRDLLFDKQWSARQAAARLAELAVHLGSSDNITVLVVAFVNGKA